MRWSLVNAQYPNVPEGQYPSRPNIAAVQGQIVHRALEIFVEHAQKFDSLETAFAAFNVRSTIKDSLSIMLSKLADNPRADLELLRSKMSLDDCVALFKGILRSQKVRFTALKGRSRESNGSDRRYGPEVWLEVDEPPICGQLDFVTPDAIIEFKTGEPSDAHDEQLRFYALIWYLKFGLPPKNLNLIYPDKSLSRGVSVPHGETFEKLKEAIVQEVREIFSAVASGNVLAKPGAANCSYCSVRQLCDSYWQSEDALGYRVLESALPEQMARSVLDVFIEKLPEDWGSGSRCIGVAFAHGLGKVRLAIDVSKTPDRPSETFGACRILGAQVTRVKDQEIVVNTLPTSEVFWIPRIPNESQGMPGCNLT